MGGVVNSWKGGFGRMSLLLALVFCCGARAEDAPKERVCDSDCVAVGQWQFNLGVGLGIRSNPLTEGEDMPLIVLPEVSYYGSRFFLRNLEMGFTLVETPRHQVNFLLTPSYDQMYFNRWDPLNLTFAGGAGLAATPIGPASPVGDYRQLTISTTRGDLTGPAQGAPGEGETVDSSTPPQDSSSYTETITFSGSIRSDVRLQINGMLIADNSDFSGAEGNVISVRVSDGRLAIDGLSASDRVRLSGDSDIIMGDLSGDVRVDSGSLTHTRAVNIATSGDSFVVSATASDGLGGEASGDPTGTEKVAFDAVRKRSMSGLAGIEYSYSTDWMSIHFQGLQDFTNVHHGQEYRAAVVFPWTFESQKLAFTLGVNHKSQRVLDYYYGIEAAEASAIDAPYAIESAGTETLARLDWQKTLNANWSLRAKLQYLGLPEQIHQSPLVAKDYVLSVFVGGVYHF